jgi:hypothetical protein
LCQWVSSLSLLFSQAPGFGEAMLDETWGQRSAGGGSKGERDPFAANAWQNHAIRITRSGGASFGSIRVM